MMIDYKPLDAALKQFRLVTVKSRSHSAAVLSVPVQDYLPVHCILSTSTLNDPPQYQALSYTWGEAKDTVPITVDLRETEVTKNLLQALIDIRQENEDVVLWADAICIDQTNNTEKGEQVPLMREIYSKASNTIAFLGLGWNGSDIAMAKFNTIGSFLCDNGITELISDYLGMKSENRQFETLKRELYQKLDAQFVEALQDLETTLNFMYSMQELLSRSYWERIWIRQEFVISPNLTIKAGKRSVMVDRFRATFLYILLLKRHIMESLMRQLEDAMQKERPDQKVNFYFFQTNKVLGDVSLVSSMLGRRRQFHDPQANSSADGLRLINLLADLAVGPQMKASVAKDRIYALLGMANDGKSLGIDPDYRVSTSCEWVYTGAARAMLFAGQIDVLSLSQNRDRTSGLPSWVPDWRDKIIRPSGQLSKNTFFAASSPKLFIPANNIVGTNPDCVTLKGYFVDIIEDLILGWTPRDDYMKEDLPQLGKYLESVRNLCNKSNTKAWVNSFEIYTKASDRANAHIRIPIADQEININQFGIGGLQGATTLSQRRYASLLEHIDGKLSTPSDVVALKDVACYGLCMNDQLFRKPFLAKKGYVGLAPDHAKVGDVLAIFLGGSFPYVVRGNGDGTYKFIGDAYVHGIMYGEFTENEPRIEEFVLR